MMFALWKAVTFLRSRLLAYWKAKRAMRSQASSVATLSEVTTPSVILFSMPE